MRADGVVRKPPVSSLLVKAASLILFQQKLKGNFELSYIFPGNFNIHGNVRQDVLHLEAVSKCSLGALLLLSEKE